MSRAESDVRPIIRTVDGLRRSLRALCLPLLVMPARHS